MLAALAQWRSQDTGHRIWPGPFLAATLVGLCTAILSVAPLGDTLEQRYGLWALFQLRGTTTPPPEVVIIAMARNTGDRISVPRERSGDDPCADLRVDQTPPTHHTLGDVPERWGRCHHVELMRRLSVAKPRVVVVDVTFRPREDIVPAEDRALGRAIRELGNVVLSQRFKVRYGPDGAAIEDNPVELSRDISTAALGIAPMPLPQLASNRLDQFWTFKDTGWRAPSLPALALQAYALDVYPVLVSSLNHLAPQEAAYLALDADELRRRGHIDLDMLHLREIFRALPQSTQKADAFLTAARASLSEAQRRRLRALVALYTRDSARYINVYGPPGQIRTLHIADILSSQRRTGTPDPLVDLHDKVVFVGYADNTEWEILEKFPTVYGSGVQKTSGVELVATAFANLLDGTDPIAASSWVRFLIAFAAGSCTGLLCYSITTLAASAVALLAVAVYLGVSVLAFSQSSFWLPLFFPLALATPLGYACAVGYKLMDYKRDRATLRSILNQFVPPDVVDVLARNASDISQVKETTNVACVMTDVEDFTTLSQTLAPAQVSVLLGQYFEAIFKPVADHGGFVCDLKGDSILALWTDPGSDPGVRARVCDACLDLRVSVSALFDGPLISVVEGRPT